MKRSSKVRFFGTVLMDLSAFAIAAASRFWLGVMAGEVEGAAVDGEVAVGGDGAIVRVGS